MGESQDFSIPSCEDVLSQEKRRAHHSPSAEAEASKSWAELTSSPTRASHQKDISCRASSFPRLIPDFKAWTQQHGTDLLGISPEIKVLSWGFLPNPRPKAQYEDSLAHQQPGKQGCRSSRLSGGQKKERVNSRRPFSDLHRHTVNLRAALFHQEINLSCLAKLINLKVHCQVSTFFFSSQDGLKQNVLGILTGTWLTRTRSCSLSAWEIGIIRIFKMRRRCQLSFERIFPFWYFQVRRISCRKGKGLVSSFQPHERFQQRRSKSLCGHSLTSPVQKSHCIYFYVMNRGIFFMAILHKHFIGLCKRTAWSNTFDGEILRAEKINSPESTKSRDDSFAPFTSSPVATRDAVPSTSNIQCKTGNTLLCRWFLPVVKNLGREKSKKLNRQNTGEIEIKIQNFCISLKGSHLWIKPFCNHWIKQCLVSSTFVPTEFTATYILALTGKKKPCTKAFWGMDPRETPQSLFSSGTWCISLFFLATHIHFTGEI